MASPRGTVYLLHFDRPYKHARHYLGFARSSSGGSNSIAPAAARFVDERAARLG